MLTMKEKLLYVKDKVKDLSLLYVEDHGTLRDSMEQLLQQVFEHYDLAANGKEGLEFFTKKRHEIVITDLNMPQMSGNEMIKEIKKIDPFVKILIASAETKVDGLLKAIDAGVFRFLLKPLKLDFLVDALYDVVKSMEAEENHLVFEGLLKDIFTYQDQLVMMYENNEPIIVNDTFLEFIGMTSLSAYEAEHEGLDALFIKEEGFLSNEGYGWFETARSQPKKRFHAKLERHDGVIRHVVVKLSTIPEKENFTIVTIDDISDLNLLGIVQRTQGELESSEDQEAILKLMQVLKENQGTVKFYNFYKGIMITNEATIDGIYDDCVVYKVAYSQLKAIQFSNTLVMTSELLHSDIVSHEILEVDFDTQLVTVGKMHFQEQTAAARKLQRLELSPKDMVSLFYKESKVFGSIRLMDISTKALRLEIHILPAGFEAGAEVKISLVLSDEAHPLLITSDAIVTKVYQNEYKHFVVVEYELSEAHEDKLSNYLHQRQLTLIKEFKTL